MINNDLQKIQDDVHRELPRLCVFIPITPVIHRAARVAADQDGHGGG